METILTPTRPSDKFKLQRWIYKIQHWIRHGIAQVFCLAVAVVCLFPLVWMVASSLKTQSTVFSDMSLWVKHAHWENYYQAWTRGHFGQYFFNSILYTTIVVFGVIITASMAAYAFSRLRFPGRNFLFILLISTMMIPIPGSFIALYVLLVKLHLIDTRLGYILPQINGGLALGVFLLKTFSSILSRSKVRP